MQFVFAAQMVPTVKPTPQFVLVYETAKQFLCIYANILIIIKKYVNNNNNNNNNNINTNKTVFHGFTFILIAHCIGKIHIAD